jgi:hypothetical protein
MTPPTRMIQREFGNWGSSVKWTYEVGPSGVNLQSNIPTGNGGFVSVYLDFGPIQGILRDGREQWSEHWLAEVRAAVGEP